MRMRVKRLQKIMEGEYACCLSGVIMYSEKRGCMNIIRIYERRIREVLGFYDFGDMSNEINLLLFLSAFYLVVFVPPLYMLELVMTNLRTEQKSLQEQRECRVISRWVIGDRSGWG